ncbi:MAG: ATP-binding protein [Rhodothermales bacterium]
MYLCIDIPHNGSGMTPAMKEIFPSTTEPTGAGTGLGLSLSYDIITKGHRGKLRLYLKLTKE